MQQICLIYFKAIFRKITLPPWPGGVEQASVAPEGHPDHVLDARGDFFTLNHAADLPDIF